MQLGRSAFGWAARLALVLVFCAGVLWWTAGFLDHDPVHMYRFGNGVPPVAVAYFSGDMGMRVGMGSYVAPALAKRGIPVFAISSSTAFKYHRDKDFVDRLVAYAAEAALDQTGASKLVLLGQSFGSDILISGFTSSTGNIQGSSLGRIGRVAESRGMRM